MNYYISEECNEQEEVFIFKYYSPSSSFPFRRRKKIKTKNKPKKKRSGSSKSRSIPKALWGACPTFQSHFKANTFPGITFPNHCPRMWLNNALFCARSWLCCKTDCQTVCLLSPHAGSPKPKTSLLADSPPAHLFPLEDPNHGCCFRHWHGWQRSSFPTAAVDKYCLFQGACHPVPFQPEALQPPGSKAGSTVQQRPGLPSALQTINCVALGKSFNFSAP